jgi:hypothetical protein
MSKSINWEDFSKEAAIQIREGKGLTGKDGVSTSLLIKEVLKAAMEGGLDELHDHIRDPSTKCGIAAPQKISKDLEGLLKFLLPAIAIALLSQRQ